MLLSEYIMNLANYFKKRREQLGMTQKEVATKMGIPIYQHISNLERGSLCSPSFAIKLSNVLELPLEMTCKLYIKDRVEIIKKEFGVE